jgi:hypothetical protein
MTTHRRRPIEVAKLTTLMVPTVRRPACGAAPDPQSVAVTDVQLASPGSQVRARQGPFDIRNVPCHEECRGRSLHA